MPEWWQKIVNSKSKTFFAFCFCFIVGAGLFSLAESSGLFFYLYVLFIAAVLLAVFFCPDFDWHRNRGCSILSRFRFASKSRMLDFAEAKSAQNRQQITFLILCSLFFILGGLRFLSVAPAGGAGHVSFYNGASVNLTGWISREPAVKINEVIYTISARACAPQAACAKNVSGMVLVKLPLYPQYNFGDTLEIKCRLEAPQNSYNSDFNFKKHLAKEGVWSICASPKIISAAAPVTGGIKLARQIYNLKIFFQNQINRLWPEPRSSLMAGLLYGGKTGLPPDLIENFNRVGLSHIVAISGFNISIIATYLLFILIYAGLYRQRAFWLVVGGIIFFVIFTGASASVVRAGIMGIVVLIARQVGRLTRPGNVLVFTAAVMAAINPYVLVWDAGFQLSFAAAMGLIYLSPVLEKRLVTRYNFLAHLLQAILIPTLSAIIATLPLTLWQFGRFSAVAPLTNLLVLWTIPALMLFGAAALFSSFIFYPLGQAVAWVAGVGLSYVIMIADWFGRRGWSAVELKIPWWLMAAMYLVIYFIVRNRSKKSPLERGRGV